MAFDDGGTAYGSFAYDAASYGAVHIKTTAGSAFGGGSLPFARLVTSNASEAEFLGFDGFDLVTLQITYSNALTTNPADTSIDTSQSSEGICLDATCTGFSKERQVTSGSVAVPAPSSLIFGLARGIALLAGRRRRQKYEEATRQLGSRIGAC